MTLPVHLPDDAYLLKLGTFSYAIAALEGTILFDLPRLVLALPDPPQQLTAEDLAPLTLFQLGQALQGKAKRISNSTIREYVNGAGHALCLIGGTRNAIAHSRPASLDDVPRLYRWNLAKGEYFWIDDAYIDKALDNLAKAITKVNELRAAPEVHRLLFGPEPV